MIRLMLAMAVASALVTACSGTSAPQAGDAGDKAAAPAAAAPAGQSGAAGAPVASTAGRASEPSPPPVPTFREVTIPAETSLTVKLTTPIGSDTSKVEDQVSGTLARPIVVSGETAVPAGAEVIGSVLEANRSGRVKGRASIAFRFDHLVVGGERHQIQTERVAREAVADSQR